jgi:flagellin
MRINQNISAMNTYSRLTSANTAKSNSLAKLSSGLRINKAGDDAAGLAISEKMRGQIGGLNQAVRNAQDGISLIQTAEGALSETHSILQRMRDLAVQSSNDTNTLDDRREIQKEIEQLKSEINRISDTTEFNTQKLLNGSLGSSGTSSDTGVVELNSASGLKTGDYDVEVTQAATKAITAASTLVAGNSLNVNGITIDVTGIITGADFVSKINEYTEETGVTAGGGTALNDITFESTTFGSSGQISVSGDALTSLGAVTDGLDAIATITDENSVAETITGTGQIIDYRGAELEATGAGTATITVTSSGASLQIGANKDQSMSIDISEMSTKSLGSENDGYVKDVNVSTQEGANNAIKTLDEAIKSVSAERSKLGATQNRLDHTINNLTTTSENLSAAESRIRDVDMAQEMMEFTKNNILSQAATSMLAQANQMPQSVLQLLQ